MFLTWEVEMVTAFMRSSRATNRLGESQSTGLISKGEVETALNLLLSLPKPTNNWGGKPKSL